MKNNILKIVVSRVCFSSEDLLASCTHYFAKLITLLNVGTVGQSLISQLHKSSDDITYVFWFKILIIYYVTGCLKETIQ